MSAEHNDIYRMVAKRGPCEMLVEVTTSGVYIVDRRHPCERLERDVADMVRGEKMGWYELAMWHIVEMVNGRGSTVERVEGPEVA
jgi:hypothetical protein